MPGIRNRKGQFMTATPNPLAKSANPVDTSRLCGPRTTAEDIAKFPVARMTHAVIVPLGAKRHILSLHSSVEQARDEARRSIFADATVVAV